MKTIAKLIKDARKKSGLTQAELAKELGYTSPQFISNWTRGLAEPPPKVYKQLGALLDVPVEKLIRAHLEEYKQKLIEKIG